MLCELRPIRRRPHWHACIYCDQAVPAPFPSHRVRVRCRLPAVGDAVAQLIHWIDPAIPHCCRCDQRRRNINRWFAEILKWFYFPLRD